MGTSSLFSTSSVDWPGDVPGVWHADELAGGPARIVATGHARLDAELPGGGWPLGALTELLQAEGAPVWSLLLPALAEHWRAHGEAVVLVRPPHEPFMPALLAAGLPGQAVLWIRPETLAASLWAAEQSLKCAGVGAVVAWLPGARATDLRRLQGAATRRASSLLFVVRPKNAASSASPARVRLTIRGVQATPGSDRLLEVDILKRRGPPLAQPLFLPAESERIRALLAAHQPSLQDQSGGAAVLPFAWPREDGHVRALDRIAVAA